MAARNERLALNLFDLDQLHSSVRINLLAGKLDLSRPVWVDKSKMEETCVIFSCDLLTACQVYDILGSQARKGDPRVRAYIQYDSEGPWVKLPATLVLTEVVDGSVILSRKVFGLEEDVPLAPQRIEI